MPSQQRLEIDRLVARDLIDADLDAAFALLYAAETNDTVAESHSRALRAIEEARNVIRDGEKRLRDLDDRDRERLRIELARIRDVVENVGAVLKGRR